MFDKIKRWYDWGIWSEAMVRNAVFKGVITQAECDEILGIKNTRKKGV